jgi:osmotically inducible lipoprotein OsmB
MSASSLMASSEAVHSHHDFDAPSRSISARSDADSDLMPRSARIFIFGVLLFIVFALSGCASTSVTKQQVGTATGAVVGGVVGSYVTGGSTAGTVAGAAGGALIGNHIGKQLDKVK